MKSPNLIFLFILCPLLFVAPAHAGYLTIIGKSEIKFSLEGDQVKVSGTYEITNKGDEFAKDVFPSFTLGRWIWAGDAKGLYQNESSTWSLDLSFPVEKLGCEAGVECAGGGLPLKGLFPLLIRRYYQDANGYQFSAPEVNMVELGQMDEEAKAAVRTPALMAKLSFLNDEASCAGSWFCELSLKMKSIYSTRPDYYEGLLEINNVSREAKKVSVIFHSAKELQVLSGDLNLDISAAQVKQEKVDVKNFSGLIGSSYGVFAIMQWEEKGVRNAFAVNQLVNLKPPPKAPVFLIGAMVAVLVLPLMLYVFVFKAPKQGKK